MSFQLKNRIKCERRIVERVVDDALKAGYSVTVNDGEEDVLFASLDKVAILKSMFSTDEDRLYFHTKSGKASFGWVYFIYGNDGPDVINDWTDNEATNKLLMGANALANQIEENGL